MKTKTIINTLKYWEDISDCVCDNTTPIGGCLKCDMRECIEQLEEIAPYLEDVKYVFQVGMDGKQKYYRTGTKSRKPRKDQQIIPNSNKMNIKVIEISDNKFKIIKNWSNNQSSIIVTKQEVADLVDILVDIQNSK